MFHYLFTNDLRISRLDEALVEAGNCFKTNTVPSASVDKNANNNMNTLGFYFNLTQNSNCSVASSEGEVRKVVLNFIKKFQFPNPRTSTSLTECISDGITLAPMRVILQVLYMMKMMDPDNAFLSRKEIVDYIFFNESIAKTMTPDTAGLARQILDNRTENFNEDIPDDDVLQSRDCCWKQCKRQVREMVKTLSWAGCIVENEDGTIQIKHDNLSRENKADIFDIITYTDFWRVPANEDFGVRKESYQDYIDIEIEYVTDEDIEERNKRLFTYWMKTKVKPEGDSDAGMPYSADSISTYVSFIASTKMCNDERKSLFCTTNEDAVQETYDAISSSDSATSRQKSAVKKYFEFVSEYEEIDVEDIYKHNLYGIHIKNKNDALSDDNSHICIGWSALGNLSDIKTKSELEKVFDDTYQVENARSRGQQVGQVWRFCNELKVGDYVIYADSDVFHIGRVESDYYYDDSDRPEQDFDYKNNRKVKWLKKGISRSTISAEFHRALMTAMSIFTINDYKSAVVDLIKDVYVKDENEDMEEEYMELVYNTSLDSDFDRNRIIFGAPGTGKSFTLNEQAKGLIDATDGRVERVTFHPDYTYSQFVGAYKPTMDGKDIRYEFVPGPFMRVYVEALKSGRTDNPQPFLLIVEEINRAKVAGVFGDIFQLLDRDDDGVSVYEIQASEDIKKYLAEKLGGQPSDYTNIRIPNNMFIWATMNSADQGVFPMDTAFKRRWSFEYLGIDAGEDKLPTGGKFTIAGTEIEWNKLRKGINAKMTSPDFHINEDKLMGPFFLSGKLLKSDEDGNIINTQKFIDVFKSKVLMYLYEDAIKQRKHDFFHNCDTSKYSSVCDAFDEHGVEIFGSNFMSDYYDK